MLGRTGRDAVDQLVVFDAAGGVVAHPAANVLHADLPDAVRGGDLQTRLGGLRVGGAPKEQYSISESSQSGVVLLSGRAGGGKGP